MAIMTGSMTAVGQTFMVLEEKERANWDYCGLSKPQSSLSDIPSPKWPHLLTSPKLGTNCSNIWIYGGHSHSKHNSYSHTYDT